MTDSYIIRGRIAILGAMVLFVSLIACGKAIPVQELDAARQEIDAAASENASEYAAETYTQAREALLSAHQNLADDELSSASSNAAKAQAFAVQARSTAAPKHTSNKATAAKIALASADEAYAEALAPRDFAAAKELYEDGGRLESSAKTLITDNANVKEGLYNYSEATRKYEASNEAATKARNLALSQKGDILDSLAGIKSRLEKAEVYGAAQEDPETLASAKSKLVTAEELIKADKLKDGHAQMQAAEQEAATLLAAVEGKYATKKLAEAKDAVGKSEKHFTSIDTPANKNTVEKKAIIATLNEQVGAAGEALKSSEGYFSDKKFSDSINESEEAIRLSQIIYEQSNLLARARNAKLDVGGSDVNDSQMTGDYKNYSVRNKKPADSLWRIAKQKKHYGNGHYWKRIYQANKSKIKNPNLIFPGQKFVIPPKKGPVKEVNSEEKTETVSEDKEEGKTLEEQLKEEARKKAEEEAKKKMDEIEQPRENEG